MAVKQVRSRTYRLSNAIVTIHEFSAGTAVRNVTCTKNAENHAAIWVGNDELLDLAAAFQEFHQPLAAGEP